MMEMINEMEQELEQQVEEPEQVEKTNDKPKKARKKRRNFFKWVWDGAKWTFKKVRESPAAALIGGIGGSALTFGGIALGESIKAKRYATIEAQFSEAEPLELPPTPEEIENTETTNATEEEVAETETV